MLSTNISHNQFASARTQIPKISIDPSHEEFHLLEPEEKHPQSQLITNTRLLLWRTHTAVHVFVYYHYQFDFFEVVVISCSHGTELNRLYVPCEKIYSILQESSSIKLAKQQMVNLRYKMMRSAAEYTIGALDGVINESGILPMITLQRREGDPNIIPCVRTANGFVSDDHVINLDAACPIGLSPVSSSEVWSIVKPLCRLGFILPLRGMK